MDISRYIGPVGAVIVGVFGVAMLSALNSVFDILVVPILVVASFGLGYLKGTTRND